MSLSKLLPKLPKGAAYLHLSNPARRNALSFTVLSSLRDQLLQYNHGQISDKPLLLPDRNVEAVPTWLSKAEEWHSERSELPKVLVLRSTGPVFSSGHDLKEMQEQGKEFTAKTFDLCASVMKLMQQCPIPIVAPIQGLATAAGFQLAMSADYPIAMADTMFQLPGLTIGLPCTSPATSVSRKLPPALAYRMYMTGEPMRADQLQGAVDIVEVPENYESTDTRTKAFEDRVSWVIDRLVNLPAQPQAYGKWAFRRQLAISDGSEMHWAGRTMVAHSQSRDAQEGIDAFLSKRKPNWIT